MAVLFVIGSELTRRARDISADVPVVFITPGDPVGAGLVASLGRPGRNTTGMTFEYPELSAKRLELVKEVLPAARRVLLLYDPGDGSPRQGAVAARVAGPRLGLTLVEQPTGSTDLLPRVLDRLSSVDAVLAIPGGRTAAATREIIQAAAGRRVPTVVHAASPATEGALLSYGSERREDRRAPGCFDVGRLQRSRRRPARVKERNRRAASGDGRRPTRKITASDATPAGGGAGAP